MGNIHVLQHIQNSSHLKLAKHLSPYRVTLSAVPSMAAATVPEQKISVPKFIYDLFQIELNRVGYPRVR